MDLIKYDTARMWLAQAASVDEVKEIRNKASGLEEYARQANDTVLLEHAVMLIKRAERRIGEMMDAQPKATGTRGQGRPSKLGGVRKTPPNEISYAEAGIDKNLAKRARKSFRMKEEEFETWVADIARRAAHKMKSDPKKKLDYATKLAIARRFLDDGIARDIVAQEFGVGENTVTRCVEAERARREPQVDPNELSLSAQEKLKAAINSARKSLEADFERKVRDSLKEALNDTVLPHYNKKMDEFDEVIKSRRGIMDRNTYKLILACLHPDQSSSAEKIRRAFDAFRVLELVLCDEAQLPTSSAGIPKTYEEMMKRREEVRASRRKKNDSSGQVPATGH